MGEYLIPANSKKSMLIFGMFNPIDLVIFGVSLFITVFCLMIFPKENTILTITGLIPVCAGGLLVFPVPNYHNVMQFLINMYNFYTVRQKFIWKGWSYNGSDKK